MVISPCWLPYLCRSAQEEENPSDEEDAARVGAAIDDIFTEFDTLSPLQQQ
jgi:hypothetical protein